nr:Hairy/enhancer-of-split with YRPW motif protein 2 [Exophiala xenobiotica]
MPSAIPSGHPVPSVWTSDEGSMAQVTAATRWPKIVQDMIEDIGETARLSHVPEVKAESMAIQIALKDMKNEIQENKSLRPLKSDGRPDIGKYNNEIERAGKWTWLSSPWLFAECYLYRRVQTILSISQRWKNYDVFKRQKDSTFAKSRVAVEELASRYIQIFEGLESSSEESSEELQKRLFIEMTEIALWGNATDLSLLSHLSLEDLQNLQGRDAIAKSQRNIIDNDTDDVYSYFKSGVSTRDRRVDIVLDNAGFEFFTDVLYAAYLLDSGFASSITFHAKDFPWFVSDVVQHDVQALFEHLISPELFPNRQYLDELVLRLENMFDSGAVTVKSHPFWTTACSFHEMPQEAPDLFQELKDSFLVVFKGDLNYRKLTKDGLWPYTTTFREAIGPLGKSGMHVLALRTNKSDTCVGVESQQGVERLDMEAPGSAWVRNGKYAVVSFCEGRLS